MKNFKVVYVIEVTEIILNLFDFFLRKDSVRIKTLKNKRPTYKTKISEQKTTKATIFYAHKLLRGVKVTCFVFGASFYA